MRGELKNTGAKDDFEWFTILRNIIMSKTIYYLTFFIYLKLTVSKDLNNINNNY